jgi:hypothetical protein
MEETSLESYLDSRLSRDLSEEEHLLCKEHFTLLYKEPETSYTKYECACAIDSAIKESMYRLY